MATLNNDLPKEQGLYHPSREHDACGVAFIANIKGKKSHQLVQDALSILKNLTHRGAAGADPLTGDGAGILLQIPHEFFKAQLPFELPKAGDYACGNILFPMNSGHSQEFESTIEHQFNACGLKTLGWREVPTKTESNITQIPASA